MGRRRTGEKPYTVFSSRGIAAIRTTLAKRFIRVSLGVPWRTDKRSQSEIESLAAKKYAEIVAGRVTTRDERIRTHHTAEELIALWLVDAERLFPRSYKLTEIHARNILAFSDSISELMSDDGAQRFAYARLSQVLRITVRKELSSLFAFYEWCKAHNHIASIPPRPNLPRGAPGKRSGPQRAKPVQITHEEALAVIDALPEWAAKGGRGRDPSKVSGAFRVRDVFVFAYETGLRPGTLARMSVPEHWNHGKTTLTISEDIDKGKYAREVPLSEKALDVLERCAPSRGLIFGRHDYRIHLKRAALAVLGEERAEDFAAYDFRHGRATRLLAVSQDLLGTAYLVGHKQVTTTNRYIHAAQAQAARALELDRFSSNSAAERKR